MSRLRRTLCALVVAAACLAAPSTAGAAITLTEFSAGITPNSAPGDIAAGPDGNLWFTELGGNRIGRITPAGVVTEFSSGITPGAGLNSITAGPDGNLWFTEGAGRIGRITPAGAVTEFSAGITAGSTPAGITAGPDGNLWFAELGGNRIGRITPTGVVTEFSAGITAGSGPFGITAGPDGNLWFTEGFGNRIGRITPAGAVTEFSAGITPSGGPTEITAGPDGNLWFTEFGGGNTHRVARITPAGVVTEFTAGIPSNSGPYGITAGPDGNLWFAEYVGNRIARITPSGVVTDFSAGITANSGLVGIVAGPDDNLWFTEQTGSRIGRLKGIGADGDEDGLLDKWETDGLDSDNDGTIDLDLPAMGADPDHKDIFLELDVMPGHALSQTAIDHVIAAFANAPVTNPDTTQGINLHVDNGSASVMTPGGATWGALSDQDTVTHTDVLGTFTAPRVYNWAAFDAIRAAKFSADREPAFHYIVSGHGYGSASNDSSGISRGIGASDLLVTLGPASEPGEGSGTVEQQAGTLMHELGHNLGLRHGGDDGDNYKANYLSIMNYSFQFRWLRRANGTSVLDYSRFEISLNESALNETSGFSLPATSPAAAFVTLAGCPNDPAPAKDPSILNPTPVLAGAVDWNCNTLADGTVAADINDDGAQTGFAKSINDWEALVYDGGAVGSPGGTVTLPATTEQIEPQLDELLRNEQALDDPLRPLPVAKPPAATPKKKCKKGRKLKKGRCVKKKRKRKRTK